MGVTHHGGGAPYKTNEGGLRESGHADQGNVQSLGFGLKRGFVPLITAPDVDEAVNDCASLLKAPGGRLLYLEHVAAASAGARAFQRLNQHTYWWLIGDGCQLCRDTNAALDAIPTWRRIHHERRGFMGGLFPVICGACEAR